METNGNQLIGAPSFPGWFDAMLLNKRVMESICWLGWMAKKDSKTWLRVYMCKDQLIIVSRPDKWFNHDSWLSNPWRL